LGAVDQFLRKVLRSGLLSREQLQSTLRSLPKDRREEVPAIAEHLVEHRKLTRFQVHKLLQGITVGLVMGPYHIQVPIGRGGMGTVYLALDTRSQEYVALKILPPKVARSEERLLVRFQREMELSKKVNHPHLAQTVEAGAYQNIHYIAMEYIPGQTLYRLVMAKGPLPLARAAHLFAEVASALAHAHGQGLIHRDLKPSNIMVTPDDHAKVLDLGLAFVEGDEVEDIEVVGGKGYIVGSIDYMAPEQTRDPTSVDARADIYALGCCLFFALTGAPPFPRGTTHEKVRAHRNQEPESIRERNAQVPEAFAALVHRMLAKNPAQRFASAKEVVAALAPWRDPTQLADLSTEAGVKQVIDQLVSGWTAPESSAKESADDAVLFRIESDEKPTTVEILSRSIFSEIDRRKVQYSLLVVVVGWIVLSMMCGLGACVYSLLRR
jgi:serine/threonine protein kinase